MGEVKVCRNPIIMGKQYKIGFKDIYELVYLPRIRDLHPLDNLSTMLAKCNSCHAGHTQNVCNPCYAAGSAYTRPLAVIGEGHYSWKLNNIVSQIR
jgi:hypothetical protein